VSPDINEFAKKNVEKLILLAPIVAFSVPLLWLYLLNPASFDALWKGRTFQLFFVWLILLELILGWETLQKGRIQKLTSVRFVAFFIALLSPCTW
jgi:hypothetical protein